MYNSFMMDNMDFNSEINLIRDQLIKKFKPEKIILFGSLARGEINKNSDIDLLIIKNDKQKRPFRIKAVFEAIRGIKRNFPLDALVYTQEEIEKRLVLGDHFIKNVFTEGKVLYG